MEWIADISSATDCSCCTNCDAAQPSQTQLVTSVVARFSKGLSPLVQAMHLAMGRFLLASLVVARAQRCPSDGVTFLQSHHAKQGLGDACLPTINTGTCTATACTGCPGGATIPSDDVSFPDGKLLCECPGGLGGGSACTLSAGSPAYEFEDPNDCLVCTGSNQCCRDFKVENMGAVCCSDGACQSSSFTLAALGGCDKDVCCSDGSCGLTTLSGVASLSCTDNNACDQVDADLRGENCPKHPKPWLMIGSMPSVSIM